MNGAERPIVDVVLPCRDAVMALPWVLGRMPAGCRPIVVDRGSRDGSAEVARSLGATVVPVRARGAAAARRAGLRAATAPVVCFWMCDASLDPREIPRVTGPVLAGSADLVSGRGVPLGREAGPGPGAGCGSGPVPGPATFAGPVLRRRDRLPVYAARRTVLLALDADGGDGRRRLETRAAEAGRRLASADVRHLPRAWRPRIGDLLGSVLLVARDRYRERAGTIGTPASPGPPLAAGAAGAGDPPLPRRVPEPEPAHVTPPAARVAAPEPAAGNAPIPASDPPSGSPSGRAAEVLSGAAPEIPLETPLDIPPETATVTPAHPPARPVTTGA